MSWLTRALAWLLPAQPQPQLVDQRALVREDQHVGVGGGVAGGEAPRPYDVQASMSAYGGIAWVYIGTRAVAEDLARVPVKLWRGEGEKAVEVMAHPVLDMLRMPNSDQTGADMTQQRVVDRMLTGTAYRRLLGVGGRPTGMVRLHPEHVRVVPAANGLIDGFVYRPDGLRKQWLERADVLYDATPSWESGPQRLYGQGIIRALHDTLTADKAARERTAEAHRQGRPEALVTPPDSDLGQWTAPQTREVRGHLESLFSHAHGGVAVLGHAVNLEKLSWSPADLAAGDTHDRSRDEALAACGVPPTRVGLPTANYATAREQMRQYWSNTIVPWARAFDAVDTRLAQRFDPQLRVVRDFSGVEALQEDRTARLDRVQRWVFLGWSPEQAAAMEGFDVPEQDKAPAEEAPVAPDKAPEEEEDVQGGEAAARLLSGDWRTGVWLDGAARQLDLTPDRELDSMARALAWHGWVKQVQEPGERRLGLVGALYLRRQRSRLTRALRGRLEKRSAEQRNLDDLVEGVLADVFDGDTALWAPAVEEVTEAGHAFTSERLPHITQPFDPVAARVADRSAALVANVDDTTRAAVRAQLTEGLEAGEGASGLAARLRAMPEFEPVRAARIARTTATAAANAGQERAMQEAVQQGVNVKNAWLSSRDGKVRHTHQALDGQVRAVGENFVSPSGASGPYPGALGSAAEDVNCRCTTIPVLED